MLFVCCVACIAVFVWSVSLHLALCACANTVIWGLKSCVVLGFVNLLITYVLGFVNDTLSDLRTNRTLTMPDPCI